MARQNRKKNVEDKLRQYAAACVKISAEMGGARRKEERIEELLQITPQPRTRGSRWDFVLEQIGYLGRYCLVWQILWAVIFLYLMWYGVPYFGSGSENDVLVMLSLLPPLLAMLTVEEITKVYQRSMLEIEYATKYSLQSVVIVRMLALSVVHLVILAAVIIIFHAGLDSGIGRLFVYGFTPMVLVTGLLMALMQHCHGEQLRSAGIGVYAVAAVSAIVGNTRYFGWYRPDCFRIWCAVFVVGIVFGVWQSVRLQRKLASFEQIIKL